MNAKIISLEKCKYYFDFDLEGNLYWKVSGQKIRKGSIAGSYHKSTGYYMVKLNGKLYMIHRILYQLYENVTLNTNQEIDHINCITTDNRKENLKECVHEENSRNRKTPKNNKSTGLKNISIMKTDVYEYYYIKIVKNKKIVFSKCYRMDNYTLEDMIKIRDEQLKIHHGEFHSLG